MLDADPTFDRDPHYQVTRNPRCTTPTPTIVGNSEIRPKWLADRFREACIRCDVAQLLIALRLLDLCPDELMHGVDGGTVTALSPRPTQRPAAIAPASVTRTSPERGCDWAACTAWYLLVWSVRLLAEGLRCAVFRVLDRGSRDPQEFGRRGLKRPPAHTPDRSADVVS